MQDTPANTSTWFYEERGERKGGITEEALVELIRSGNLGYGSNVWTDGFPEWVKLEHTRLKEHLAHIPPPLSANKENRALMWTLAFAPFLGTVVAMMVALLIHQDEYEAEEALSGGLYWVLVVGLNILLSVLDEKQLKKAGFNTAQFNRWTWLVPVYLYQRAQNLGQGRAYLVIWSICFVLFLLTMFGPTL